ncbi:hypothetical protein NEUTE2DRAFT_122871 [Neurospora tetrasperma FGSC 2509]|nr:hypothetical protein NEUTE2DRAFT_122871 [Neurospora tetrasperma FGSC 2509]
MTGDGSDDYIWVWSDGHAAELYINHHDVPHWEVGPKDLFNIARSRRSIHIADWDGDGRCDVISQQKSDGALEMRRNDYNPATGAWKFTYMGFVTGGVCPQGWGVNVLDRGMRLAISNGHADVMCLEKNGRITGWLNHASGNLENVGQVKYSEGWGRANLRFADVEDGGNVTRTFAHSPGSRLQGSAEPQRLALASRCPVASGRNTHFGRTLGRTLGHWHCLPNPLSIPSG